MSDQTYALKLAVRDELEEVDIELFRKDFNAMINSISVSKLNTNELKEELYEFVQEWMDMYDHDVYAFRHYFLDLAFFLAEENTEHQLNPYHHFEFKFYDDTEKNVRLAACTLGKIIDPKYLDAVLVKYPDPSAPDMKAFDTDYSVGDWVKPLHYNVTRGFNPKYPLDLPHGFIGLISEFRRFTCSSKSMIEKRLKQDPHIFHSLPRNWFDKLGMSKDYSVEASDAKESKWEPLTWTWEDERTPESVKNLLTIINKPITMCKVQFNHDLKIDFYSHELVKVDGPAKPTSRRRFVE